jgi:cephalosporin-C deacetylase
MLKKYKASLFLLLITGLAAGIIGLAPCRAQVIIPKDAPKKIKAAEKEADDEEVIADVIPRNKNGVFNDDDAVFYKVKVKSTYKELQEGKLTYDLLTDDNKLISSHYFPVKLTHNSSEDYSITIPKQKAGFYRLNVRMNFTSYDDTIKRVFGVSPEKVVSTLHRPVDFDTFWKGTIAELKKVPPQYKIMEQKDLSTKDKKVYLVEMRSYGNVLIRGWMVIPTFGHRFPVHYRVPGYGVEMHPNMDADDFIAFDLNVRGSGNSQDQIKLNTDIYSTTGLEDRDRYIYRGAYMDCIRGFEFLYSHHDIGIDTARIYVEGGSQGGALGIMTAALEPRVRALSVQVPLYSDIRDTYDISATYTNQVFPFKMFRNYKKSHPGYTWDEFYKVFDYYDPQNFAPLVKCPVLMGIGLLDLYCPPRSSMAMFNHIGAEKKEYVTVANTTHEVNFNYFMFQNNWLREQLRIP